jgi:hypothetical protein
MLRPKSSMVLRNIGLRKISFARLRTPRKSSDDGLEDVCFKEGLLLVSEALLIFNQMF